MSGYIGTQPVPQATQTRDSFTCTAGQTSFATSGYTPNFLDVYLNGVKLTATDYTASNGSDVVLAAGASTGDVLEVVAFTPFEAANVTGATDFTVTGNLSVDGGTIKLDGNYPVGGNNVMLGSASGTSLTTGYNNVAIGPNAFDAATDAHSSIAIGQDALTTNTTGAENTAVGQRALYLNTTGGTNVALGRRALENNTTASSNTAVGYQAGYSATTSGLNTFVGQTAGYNSNSTNGRNTFIGTAAGYAMTTGEKNTIIGRYSGNFGGLDIRTSSNNIVLSDGDGNPRVHIDSSGFVKNGGISSDPIDSNEAGFSLSSAARRFHSTTAESTLAVGTSQSSAINFFKHNGSSASTVGSITVGASSTAYNTSSDYRLKENVVDLTGATTRLKQLEPKRFNFIADADTTVDGFIAHEVQSVVPEAITGTHNEVDGDGNPVYQGIDQSKLVPLLVATIKELEARITALENA